MQHKPPSNNAGIRFTLPVLQSCDIKPYHTRSALSKQKAYNRVSLVLDRIAPGETGTTILTKELLLQLWSTKIRSKRFRLEIKPAFDNGCHFKIIDRE